MYCGEYAFKRVKLTVLCAKLKVRTWLEPSLAHCNRYGVVFCDCLHLLFYVGSCVQQNNIRFNNPCLRGSTWIGFCVHGQAQVVERLLSPLRWVELWPHLLQS
jgi:hypothetical protein